MSIQPRTSPIKFAHLAEKSEEGSISNFSTKALGLAREEERGARVPGSPQRLHLAADAGRHFRFSTCFFGIFEAIDSKIQL